MNRPALLILVPSLLLAGCAAFADCEDAMQAGLSLGLEGQTPTASQRAAGAACDEAFKSGWTEGLAHYCQPRAGFERALHGQEEAGACAGREFRIDFELGRNIRALREERAILTAGAESESEIPSSGPMRLRFIDRELAQLEGLARIRGLLSADPE